MRVGRASNRSPNRQSPARSSAAGTAAVRHALTPAIEGLGDGLPMINESFRDFSQAAAPRTIHASRGRRRRSPRSSTNRRADEARQAIATAYAAFPAWRDRDPLERSRIILKAAALMRDRRDELSAIMIREAGKPWREADADTCEAIDFCEYYAREAVGLFQPRAAGPVRRRVEPPVAPAARRGLGHQPVELPAGHLLRHDRRGAWRWATRRS